MRQIIKCIWISACFLFLHYVAETTDVTWTDCVIHFLLMGYLIKDDVAKAWHEVLYGGEECCDE